MNWFKGKARQWLLVSGSSNTESIFKLSCCISFLLSEVCPFQLWPVTTMTVMTSHCSVTSLTHLSLEMRTTKTWLLQSEILILGSPCSKSALRFPSNPLTLFAPNVGTAKRMCVLSASDTNSTKLPSEPPKFSAPARVHFTAPHPWDAHPG